MNRSIEKEKWTRNTQSKNNRVITRKQRCKYKISNRIYIYMYDSNWFFCTRFPSKCEANTCIRLTYRKPCVFSNRTKYTLTCSRKNVEFGNESLAFPRMTTMVQERNCTIQQTDLSVSETRTSKITSLNVLETPKMIYKHFSFVSYQRYPNVLCDLLFCPSSLTQSTDILQHSFFCLWASGGDSQGLCYQGKFVLLRWS